MSAKKLKIEYGDSVFSLPRENVLLTLPSASGFELKVLIIAAADDALRSDYDTACERICRQLDCTRTALARALDFWGRAGVMTDIETEKGVKADQPSTKPLISSASPTYTEGQAADVIAENTELNGIINACQQISGKIFTPADIQVIVTIYDYLGLKDTGYIETLYSYCTSMGKTSARYIEKVAVSMSDEGINTTEELNEYIKRRERCEDALSQLRTLIGAGSRALTSKERKMFECWINEWRLSLDVINRAYEVTVDKLGAAKLPYMNKVLENWHKEGLCTLEAVETSLEAYKKKKADAARSGSGFETDEYFEAALARSQRYLEGNKSGS